MKNLLRSIFLFLLLLAGLVRCATTQNITNHPTQPQPISAPNPEALAHFIDAKLLEMHGQREEAVRTLITAIAHDSTSATLYNALARNLVALQHFKYAQEPARKSIALDSSNVSSRWLLFHALMGSRQDTTAAIQELETIISINPRELEALDTLLKVYRLQDRRKDVLRILQNLAAVPNLNTRYRVFIAESYTRYQAPEDAVKLYQQILEEDPAQPEIWSRLGELTLATGDTLGAAQALRRGLLHVDNRVDRSTRRAWQLLVQIYATDIHLDSLLAEVPPDVRFLEHMADIYAVVAQNATGDDTSAVRHARYAEALLNALLQAAPNQPDLYYKKGNLLLSANRLEEAQAAFSQAISIEPSARYWLGMSHVYLRQQQWDRAIEILSTLFAQAPEKSGLFTQVVLDLGRAYTVTGQFEKSRQVYRRATQADSSQIRFHLEIGRTYVFQKDWKNAIAVFEQLMKQIDDNTDLLKSTLYELGHSYERNGQFDSGVKVFQRLLTLDPEHHQALNYLGYMLAEKGIRLNEAQDYIQRALKGDPDNGAYLDSMGWVYYQQGRYEDALEILERALQTEETALENLANSRTQNFLHENLSVIHDHAGDAARALGNLGKARYHWQRAAEFDPNNEAIRNKLQTDIHSGASDQP